MGRRLGSAATAAALAITLIVPAWAGASPDASPPAPEVLCHIDDPRLEELSGLAADSEYVYAVPDGGERLEVAVLDDDCQVREVLTAPTDPYDVEDLALAPDGTLWLGDIGDNRAVRETVALHALTRDGTATLYRLTYPDRPQDAEALVLDPSGTPYVVTKSAFGASDVYRPAKELTSPGPTPMEKVGSVSFLPTGTPGGQVGAVSSMLVTGAAMSADGSVVALRTYTDAYLYPVTDGDLVEAFTREPVRVPLPNEPQGEAIAFTPDGTLLSAGEGIGEPLRAVPDAASLVRPGERTEGRGDRGSSEESTGGEESGLSPVPAAAVAIAVAAVLVVLGSRRRRR